MGRKRRRQKDDNGYYQPVKKPHLAQDLPPGTFHWDSIDEVPFDLQHYWRQRYRTFSRYDEGILMTENAWFEVTPEIIATKIAEHMAVAVPKGRSIIVDAFCGVGGNTIAFALSGKWKRVYGVEKDKATLECAKRNARIYGVHDQITWFEGDCFEVLATDPEKKANAVEALRQVIGEYGVIFASPPWGGPDYRHEKVVDLNKLPCPFDLMYKRLCKVTKNMVLYLPRTSDIRQIARVVERTTRTDIVHYCTDGGSRALCAYLGDWTPLDIAV